VSIHRSHPLAGGQVGGSDSDFVIVEWQDAGDHGVNWIAPLHRHHHDDESWYVLEGTMRFKVGDEIFEATVGDAVLAPKGVGHTYGNARPGQPARYLLVMTPRIRSLIEALHAPGIEDPARVFAAHDSELLS
jgi:mannose-6-phosphate isomerase-like protein (cupin superfamily)